MPKMLIETEHRQVQLVLLALWLDAAMARADFEQSGVVGAIVRLHKTRLERVAKRLAGRLWGVTRRAEGRA